MEKDIYEKIKEAYTDAEMVVIGLGSQLCRKMFADDAERIKLVDGYAKLLDKKNYFVVTSHQNDIFEGTCINKRRICNPLIATEENEKQWELYNKWLSATLNRKLLIIEIGEDFNHPNVFRWPFEKIVYINQKSRLIRVGDLFFQLPADIGERAESIQCNGMTFVRELMESVV